MAKKQMTNNREKKTPKHPRNSRWVKEGFRSSLILAHLGTSKNASRTPPRLTKPPPRGLQTHPRQPITPPERLQATLDCRKKTKNLFVFFSRSFAVGV